MKYIIDIPDEKTYAYINDEKTFLRMPISLGENEIKSMFAPTMLRIKPYTEPDREAIEDEVWKNTWKMFLTTEDFGATMGDSYSEAKAKYDEWKKEKEEEAIMKEVTALAEKIGIHKLYSMVKEIRGEQE